MTTPAPPPPCPWPPAVLATVLGLSPIDAAVLYAEMEVLAVGKACKILRDALAAKGIPCNAHKLSLAWRGGIPLPTALALMASAAKAEAEVRARATAAAARPPGRPKTVSVFWRAVGSGGEWQLLTIHEGGSTWQAACDEAMAVARRDLRGQGAEVIVQSGHWVYLGREVTGMRWGPWVVR